MFPTYKNPPPFSPILLAGIVARPLPPALLQPFLNKIFTVLLRRHPGLFERLSDLTDPTFLIDPVDLPLAFVLDATPEHPRLTAGRKATKEVTAVIRGPLLTLIDLMEGRLDGDALFFSRALKIEGDTEAVVALRNAIDDAGINLIDDTTTLGSNRCTRILSDSTFHAGADKRGLALQERHSLPLHV